MDLGEKVFVDVPKFFTLRTKINSFQVKTIQLFINESKNDYLSIGI